jgi:hypothetical protein
MNFAVNTQHIIFFFFFFRFVENISFGTTTQVDALFFFSMNPNEEKNYIKTRKF